MNEKGLTKKDSQCLKGIGILFMLFYHLFRAPEVFAGHSVSFFPFDENFVVAASYMCKICVCIFAFVSGYGLLKSVKAIAINRFSVVKWNIKRLLKTMSGFWFIYVLAFIVTFIINDLPKTVYFNGSGIKGFVYVLIDFLGLSNLFSTPMLIGTWWYMSAAVIYILLVPIIFCISKKIGYTPIAFAIIFIPKALNIGFTGGRNPYTFLLVMVFGMLFADYNIFEKISCGLPKNKFLAFLISFAAFGGISIFFCIASQRKDNESAWQLIYGVFPVFVICFFRYCVIRIPVIKNILAFLGDHSMTMFLTHTFIRYTYLNEFVYSFRNFIKIYAVLFVLSVALAFVIDMIKRLIKFDKLVEKMILFSLSLVNETIN